MYPLQDDHILHLWHQCHRAKSWTWHAFFLAGGCVAREAIWHRVTTGHQAKICSFTLPLGCHMVLAIHSNDTAVRLQECYCSAYAEPYAVMVDYSLAPPKFSHLRLLLTCASTYSLAPPKPKKKFSLAPPSRNRWRYHAYKVITSRKSKRPHPLWSLRTKS